MEMEAVAIPSLPTKCTGRVLVPAMWLLQVTVDCLTHEKWAIVDLSFITRSEQQLMNRDIKDSLVVHSLTLPTQVHHNVCLLSDYRVKMLWTVNIREFQH